MKFFRSLNLSPMAVVAIFLLFVACGGGGGGPTPPDTPTPVTFNMTSWAGLVGDTDTVGVSNVEVATFQFPQVVSGNKNGTGINIKAEMVGKGQIKAFDNTGAVSDTLPVDVFNDNQVSEPTLEGNIPSTIPTGTFTQVTVSGICAWSRCAPTVVPRSTRGQCPGGGYSCNLIGSAGGDTVPRGSFTISTNTKCDKQNAGVAIKSFRVKVQTNPEIIPERGSETEVIVNATCSG